MTGYTLVRVVVVVPIIVAIAVTIMIYTLSLLSFYLLPFLFYGRKSLVPTAVFFTKTHPSLSLPDRRFLDHLKSLVQQRLHPQWWRSARLEWDCVGLLVDGQGTLRRTQSL